MLKKAMQKAINEQINAELYSSYLYLSMAAYCEANDLPGMASWFKVQAQEEVTHAMKFFNYVNDRDGRVLLAPLAGPSTDWESPLAAFKATLAHEQEVTARINKLVDLAQKDKDHTTTTFLQWFVNEQIEEEATVRQILGQLKLMGGTGQGLYMLDKELGARTFTMPAANGEPAA